MILQFVFVLVIGFAIGFGTAYHFIAFLVQRAIDNGKIQFKILR